MHISLFQALHTFLVASTIPTSKKLSVTNQSQSNKSRKTGYDRKKACSNQDDKSYSLTIYVIPRLYLYVNAAAKPYDTNIQTR